MPFLPIFRTFSYVFVFSLLLLQCSKDAKIADPQRDILIEIYQKNHPANWRKDYQDTWGTSQSVCKWFGVICNEKGEITELEVSGNRLTSLPESIGQLKTLQHLCIDLNQLTELPDTIKNLQELIQLDMAHNHFTKVPDSVTQLKNLKVLSIFHNNLDRLPENIKDLTKLSVLNVYHNQLTDLPESIVDLSKLTVLNISHNHIQQLPSLDRLSQLVLLDVSKNYWLRGTLPPTLCRHLKTFNNKHTQLTCAAPEPIK